LALVAIGGFFLGRRLGRPIDRLASAARSLGAFDLDAVPTFEGSIFREIDQAERAFDGATRGLRAFARYVPRELVRHLSQPGAIGAVRSESREVTVLFTDLVGYTTSTAALGPEETVCFLNEHFARVTACIESEGGTVDKFIGDSVMAFWGAPTPQPDHAERAVRAVRLIAEAIRDETAPGGPGRVRLRVGLASGNVVVGDIGSSSRTSYTVIGDTVNVASRLEQHGKMIDPDADVVALASGETIDRLLDRDSCQPLGAVELRGRPTPIEVFRVV
jgi:class 3 adenylate cyclase